MTCSTPPRPTRVMIMGLRGLPGVQGGVETHVEKLAPRLAGQGYEVEVLTRKAYQPEVGARWRGVHITRLWAPKSSGAEAIVHSLLCVLYAAIKRPDVLHIQAIGPALVTPLARLFGLKVVVTHHGPDYAREKWGGFGKLALRLGESLGMRLSNERIAISPVIREMVREGSGQDATLIPNGVDAPAPVNTQQALQHHGLQSQRYVLLVSRLVPEKRHEDLITAFRQAGLPPDWKLVLVGGADHPGPYVDRLQHLAADSQDVIMTGRQTGQALQELFAHAGMFVLPSSHEGLPIALLEAISHKLPVLASDIAPNLAVGLPAGSYFPLGDTHAAARCIREVALDAPGAQQRARQISQDLMPQFNWQGIAEQTSNVYQQAMRTNQATASKPQFTR